MREASSLEKALAGAVAEAKLDAPEEQLELNDVAQLPLLGEVMRDGKAVTGGRPKGAMNKATKELANYILSRHRHPVIAAAEICDIPIKDLARSLGADLLDAAKYQQQCREFVARYTLQAMPQSVHVDMGTVGMLYVINQNAPRQGETERSPFGLDMQQIQGVSDGETEASHGEKSHESAKSLTEQDNQ